MRLGARLRGPKESTKVGTMKRILISNLECYNAPMKISSILSGIPGYSIEDVKLSNIYVETVGGATAEAASVQPPEFENKYPDPGMFGPMPASGFFLRHMRNLEMSHVEIACATPDARPAFYLDRCGTRGFLRHHRTARAARRLCLARSQRPAHRLEPRGSRQNSRHRRRHDLYKATLFQPSAAASPPG